MEIDIILSADRIEQAEVQDKTVVVIDTLRATSTIITALANGSQKVIPVASINQAKEISKELDVDCLLAGERGGVKIDEFDLGNSPRDYIQARIDKKVIILTTTNGTKCFSRVDRAKEVTVASLLNINAITDWLKVKGEIVLCCAGVDGEFALDDFITAGKLIATLYSNFEIELTDRALIAYQSYLYNQDDLLTTLKSSKSGQNLINLDKEKDIDYIVQSKEVNIIPLYKEGVLYKK